MKATANVRTSVWERTLPWGGMPALLLLGFVIRLLFIQNQGFKNDVVTFEAWAIALVDHGFGAFYSKTSFADYPPGYFYVLGVVGVVWNALFRAHDAGYAVLAMLVKLPAILADLGVGWLIYAIGKRFASPRLAFGAAALYVLNPVTIFISALWGQIDSIAGGLALLAAYFLLKSEDDESDRPSLFIIAAWLVFAYSLLIKPQAAVLIPIFIAFAFVNPARRTARIAATAIGIVLSFVLAYVLSVPFHAGNPIVVFSWLLHQYAFGSSVYSYNTVNAFNLWAIKGRFWEFDSQLILWIPQVIWGVALVVAALALIVWRYVYDRTPQAMLEACAISLLAFFMLATRMHERYVFDGVLFSIACVPLARRYLWGTILLSAVLFANLKYSLDYLTVMNAHTPGIDPHNLWGPITSVYALVAVGTFFVLGYLFLGGAPLDAPEPAQRNGQSSGPGARPMWLRPADWFDPSEGLRAMRAPLDYVVMGAIGIGTFILSFVNYAYPSGKIFDEIYFARAAEEYLQNLRIYENTHPPFSKLLVTLSVMLFGGMPHGHGLGGWTGLNAIIGHMPNGDNSYGWRFLDVVFGALVVMLLYAFAKRITGSTVFAAIAAILLSLDGMHFVQSRIATPEGFVVFFSLLAVYAFYRFWIASQTNERAHVHVPPVAFAIAVIASGLTGALALGAWKLLVPPPNVASPDFATSVITICYVGLGAYLVARYTVFPRIFADGKSEITFGEGSFALHDANSMALHTADGGVLDTAAKGIQRGERSQPRGADLLYSTGDLTIAYHRDGSVDYRSPFGEATYAQNQTRSAVGSERGSSAKLWLMLFTIA
ncbi:MAG: phospholipid carrier-dependent glycosyltransferase, partial [Vulcanimicrobiaceae bacterium]